MTSQPGPGKRPIEVGQWQAHLAALRAQGNGRRTASGAVRLTSAKVLAYEFRLSYLGHVFHGLAFYGSKAQARAALLALRRSLRVRCRARVLGHPRYLLMVELEPGSKEWETALVMASRQPGYTSLAAVQEATP